MTYTSWNGVYTQVEQRFMLKRRYKLFFLLKALCQHADCFGFSYPGDDRLKELTGLGTDRELNLGLQFLVDGEYIKIWETYNPRRRGWDRDFQVSPLVLYIREELHAYCMQVWDKGERDFDLENTIVIKRNGQPDTESESETESVNQNHNHHHHPGPMPLRSNGSGGGGDDYATKDNPPRKQRKQRKPTSGKARSTEIENPQAGGGAVPPDKIDLRRYSGKLPTPDQEDKAQDLVLMFRMRINQARGLVANYAPETIDAASRTVKHAIDKGSCHNPPGLFTHLLKQGGANAADRALYPTWSELADKNDFGDSPDDDNPGTMKGNPNADV